MLFRSLMIHAAIGAAVFTLSAVPGQAQSCSPTSQVDKSQSCKDRNAQPTYPNIYGASARDDWCASTMSGKAQKDYWYKPANNDPQTYGYTVLFDCTACEGVIKGSLDADKYNDICP